MTTQDTTATAGNPKLSREFSKGSATDGQWNNMVSNLSSQAIGLELPNVTINHIQGAYAAGGAVLRIISGKTLKVKSHILAAKTGYNCMSESMIKPVKLMSDDLLQIWPVEVDAGTNDTAILALVETTAGTLPFGVNTTADNTATEILELNTGQGIGDIFFGSTVLGFEIQLEDGAVLNKVTILDSQGGTVAAYYGTVRGATGGSKSNIYNLKVKTNIPVQKGWKMYVYATSS